MNILLIINLFFLTPVLAAESFSKIIEAVYTKYQTAKSDWCNVLKQRIGTIEQGNPVSAYQLQQAGIEQAYLDQMALEFCLQNKDARIAIIWPTVDYTHEPMLINVINKHCKAIYHKKFSLWGHGPRKLLSIIPEKVPSLDLHFNYYFPSSMKIYPMICFVLTSQSLQDCINCKREIRKILGIDPFCIHISDTHEQTLDLAYLLLNDNSIHFLNYHTPQNFENFNNLIKQYAAFIKQHKIQEHDACVDGSCVLAAYGIRDCAIDFDFLCTKKGSFGAIWPLDHHNPAWETLGISVSDIIYNPKNFFYYNNLKFASLLCIRTFKQKQGRERDIKDVALIDERLKKS